MEIALFRGAITMFATPHGLIHESLAQKKENARKMATKSGNLKDLRAIDGFVGACLVDSDSGMVYATEGGGNLDLELAAAGNTEVVRAKRKTMAALDLEDSIEDILITLGTQYHIIRPLESNPTIFIYVALERSKSNLAFARLKLKEFEKTVKI